MGSIVRFEDVSFSYPGGIQVLRETTFEVHQGERACLAGASGSGKTTIALAIKGLIPHVVRGRLSGRILVDGMDVRKERVSRVARSASMVFQDLDAQLFSTTVREEIQFGLENLGLDPAGWEEPARMLGIDHLAGRSPLALSAGQKQRVVLACALATRPRILILDEPSAHLDQSSKDALVKILVRLNEDRGTTIVLIDQDAGMVGETCTSFYLVEDCRVNTCSKDEMVERGGGWRWRPRDR